MTLYLASADSKAFQIVRTVESYRHISIDGREALEVKTNIPLIGQNYGLGDYDPNIFYLISHFNDNDLRNLISLSFTI